MDIRSTPLKRGKDRRIHKPDDRRDILVRRQTLDRDVLVRIVLVRENVKRQPLARLVQHALRLLRLLQQVGNLRERRHPRHQPLPKQPGDLVQHHQLRGVGNRDRQPSLRLLQRHKVVPEHHVDRHALEELMLDLEVLQVDKLRVIPPRQPSRPLGLIACIDYRNCDWCGHSAKTPLPETRHRRPAKYNSIVQPANAVRRKSHSSNQCTRAVVLITRRRGSHGM